MLCPPVVSTVTTASSIFARSFKRPSLSSSRPSASASNTSAKSLTKPRGGGSGLSPAGVACAFAGRAASAGGGCAGVACDCGGGADELPPAGAPDRQPCASSASETAAAQRSARAAASNLFGSILMRVSGRGAGCPAAEIIWEEGGASLFNFRTAGGRLGLCGGGPSWLYSCLATVAQSLLVPAHRPGGAQPC